MRESSDFELARMMKKKTVIRLDRYLDLLYYVAIIHFMSTLSLHTESTDQ